jgi:LysM repeat protein
VFIFVTLALLGALYLGVRWASGAQGGVLSGTARDALGDTLGVATPTAELATGARRAAATTASAAVPSAAESPAPSTAADQSPNGTPAPAAPSTTNAPPGRVHVVQAGDTPQKIAQQYGVSADAIMQANNLTDPRRLRIGQELIIPDAGATSSPAGTPPPTPQP